jgi:hypothetical protein
LHGRFGRGFSLSNFLFAGGCVGLGSLQGGFSFG